MCGRFSFHTYKKLKKILKIIEEEQPKNLSDNIPPYTDVGVIYNNLDNLSSFRNMYWQLIPDFSKQFKSNFSMFNTRSDTLFDKPYKRKLITNNRCLIPVNCYYEWKKEGNRKIPYSFSLKEHEVTFLGGIYSIWAGDLDYKYSCSIITTDAAPDISHIHNRMPLIIKEDSIGNWLSRSNTDSDDIFTLITSYRNNNLVYNRALI